MSHMIDESTGIAAIAYMGETPWHGLGQEMEPGETTDQWRKRAGLDWEVKHAPVEFETFNGTRRMMPRRRVLYRSDTGHAFSVVSDRYKIVQPKEVFGFFDNIAQKNGFTLETAGSLDNGRRIWCLARVGEGAPVIGQDEVRPYVLLATAYDLLMSTVAKFTAVRVVCANTLGMSIGADGDGGEKDGEVKRVRVPHFQTFNADEVRVDLGIVFDEFEKFMFNAKRLAQKRVNDTFATAFLKMLLPPAVKIETVKGQRIVTPKPVEETKGFQQIMGLFHGEALGAELVEARGTAWGLLNAVTQHVDWQRGRTPSTRMSSAWFGEGEALKNKARDLLVEVVS